MHIAIDARMILPYQTGVGRYLVGLAQGFQQLNTDDQIEFWIQKGLPAQHPIRILSGNKIRLIELPLHHMEASAWLEIPRQVMRAKPDLLHYPHFDLPWSIPGSIVATIHDLKYLIKPQFFEGNRFLKRLIYYLMISFTVRRANRIITDSQSAADDILRFNKIDIRKISVIPLGIDPSFFQIKSPETIAHVHKLYGLDKPYLLFVGERRPHKNLTTLIKSFDHFRKITKLDYLLVIAGRSYANYQQPEKLVEDLNLQKEVIFLDYVQDKDLPMLYHSAVAFISLSLYEGFGLPALEAMASQTPVIVSNNTSFTEVVGQAGLTIPPNDIEQAVSAIREISTNNSFRQELIQSGVQRAREFTWQQCAEKTLQVYQLAIKR